MPALRHERQPQPETADPARAELPEGYPYQHAADDIVALIPIVEVARSAARFDHDGEATLPAYRGDAIKEYFLHYDETVSNDFVLSEGGRKRELLTSDIETRNGGIRIHGWDRADALIFAAGSISERSRRNVGAHQRTAVGLLHVAVLAQLLDRERPSDLIDVVQSGKVKIPVNQRYALADVVPATPVSIGPYGHGGRW